MVFKAANYVTGSPWMQASAHPISAGGRKAEVEAEAAKKP
jgi:hypothetical protein